MYEKMEDAKDILDWLTADCRKAGDAVKVGVWRLEVSSINTRPNTENIVFHLAVMPENFSFSLEVGRNKNGQAFIVRSSSFERDDIGNILGFLCVNRDARLRLGDLAGCVFLCNFNYVDKDHAGNNPFESCDNSEHGVLTGSLVDHILRCSLRCSLGRPNAHVDATSDYAIWQPVDVVIYDPLGLLTIVTVRATAVRRCCEWKRNAYFGAAILTTRHKRQEYLYPFEFFVDIPDGQWSMKAIFLPKE